MYLIWEADLSRGKVKGKAVKAYEDHDEALKDILKRRARRARGAALVHAIVDGASDAEVES